MPTPMISLAMAAWLTGAPHWVGTEVEQPHRVVSLSPTLTELVFAIGEGEHLVGVTTYDDFPKAVESLPRVGSLVAPDVERIVSLQPQVVLVTRQMGSPKLAATLARLGPSVLAIDAERIEHLFTAVSTLGQLFGSANTEATTASLRKQLAALKGQASKTPGIAVVAHQPVVVAGHNTFITEMLARIGLANPLPKNAQRYPQLDREALVHLRPKVVVDLSPGTAAARRAQWGEGPHSFTLLTPDISPLVRLGPRLFVAYGALARELRAGAAP